MRKLKNKTDEVPLLLNREYDHNAYTNIFWEAAFPPHTYKQFCNQDDVPNTFPNYMPNNKRMITYNTQGADLPPMEFNEFS